MISSFTYTLLHWYEQFARDLPWRRTKDPYAIWLSEIILQQTRVEQGRDYWQRFMERYPRVEDLAQASEDEVLRLWQGLGYYSRARNLHAAARQIVAMGGFPQTFDAIRSLKGVGDYTAAAIGSIAFGLPVAVVDGNVYRVLARHFGIDTPIDTTEGKRTFSALAQELLPEGQAASYNQALMDFGAIQCTPHAPACLTCPLAETCQALREGRVEQLPVKQRRLQPTTRRLIYIIIMYKGKTAIHRRPAGNIWQGLWEPVLVCDDGGGLEADVERELSQLLKDARLVVQGMKHVLTHRVLFVDCYSLEVTKKPSLPEGYKWVPLSSLDDYGKPRLVERLLELT